MKVLIFIFISVFLLLALHFSIAADTISASESITGSDTLVTSNQRFVLGLFSPPNSTAWYLGLWYKKFPDVVVWVANRENPLPDSNGALKLSEKGSLILSDEMNNTVWSSNSSRVAENPVAQLLVTGNLVVIDQALITTAAADSVSYVYQSFDYPSDTLLPDMKVGWDFRTGQNRFLTSWKDASDPSLGEYTYRIDNPELPQLVVAQGSKKVFRTGPWNGLRFSARVTMTESGLAQRLVVNEGSSEWAVLYTLQNNQCDVYGECGANGICKIYNSPICECVQGFVPISPKEWEFSNWTSGCTRRTKLHCEKGERFVKINNVKLPDLLDFRVNKNLLRSGDCEAECLRNCSCVAYANSNITSGNKACLMWFGKLIDMREIVELDGDQIHIRMPASELGDTSQRHKRIVLISVISSAGFMLLFLGLSCWYIYLKKREKERGSRTSEEDLELPLFDYGTIATATNDFSGTNKLGEGGFGPLYKLTQEEFVAVKRLSRDSGQGLEEFKNEVTMIANLQHWNLVKLLGCCIEGEERMLIYEYMPNKSLDCFIFDENKKLLLKWQKRRDIIIGIARGLLYLHEDSRLRIIHRDLKSSNILLDDELNPKISDFGIARIFRRNQTEAKTKRVIGTYGYMSPEYAIDGNFSVKSDVFSFGVLLLEIVSGKKNRGFHHPDHHHNLLGHVWLLWKQNKGLELMDICLEDSYVEFELLRCIQVGLLCVQKLPKDRPVMSSVVLMLSNEGATLPQPNEPGFFIERGSMDFDSSRDQGKSNTGNTITITTEEPR
ncbi:hypothetical protein ACLB2K_022091 [Fragaria x ananassa]